jgi:protein TonB
MTSLQRFFLLCLLCVVTGATGWAQADETIYTKVDENPVPVKTPPPKYPESLKRDGVSGVVAVVIVIDEKGGIMSSSIAKSSHPDFERPALDAVKNWKFKPAKKDGATVKVKVTVPLRFNVEES